MAFVSSDFEGAFFEGDVLELDASEFADSEPSLEEQFDDGVHAGIVTASVTKGAIFERGEDARGSDFVLGMRDVGSG